MKLGILNETKEKEMKAKLLALLFLSAGMVGCMPEQKPTEFNDVRQGAGSLCNDINVLLECKESLPCQPVFNQNESFLSCVAIPKEESQDGEQQAAPSDDMANEEMASNDDSKAEDDGMMPAAPEVAEDDDDSKAAEDDDDSKVADDDMMPAPAVADDDDDNKAEEKNQKQIKDLGLEDVPECKGDHKVLICHLPPGNPANAHSICISKRAYENGHKYHHPNTAELQSQDHLGACSDQDLDDDDM